MTSREHLLPLTRQCRLLNLSRSGIYYNPVPVSDRDRDLMRLMDEIHLEYPFMGSRGIKNELWNKGHKVEAISAP
jgi:putative transposase